MALRIPWDKYETALLIEACIKTVNHEMSWKKAITETSKALRRRAAINGIPIDEIYRNENGISFQLGKIKKLMEGESPEKFHAATVFVDMVKKYYSDRMQFNAILDEAKLGTCEMISDSESVALVFVRWMTDQSLPKDIAEAFASSIRLVDEFALKNEVSDELLFTTVDGEKIEGLKIRLDENPDFWDFNRNNHYRPAAALNQYIAFRMSLPDGSFLRSNEKEALTIKKEFVQWALDNGFPKATTEAFFAAIKTVDLFVLNYGLAKTSLFLLEDLKDVLFLWKKLLNDPLFTIYNSKKQGRFKYAVKRFIAFKELKKLNFDGGDYDGDFLAFQNDKLDEEGEEVKDDGLTENEFDKDEEYDEDRVDKKERLYSRQKEMIEFRFSDWMRRNGYVEGTIRSYLRALNYVEKYVLEQNNSKISLYAIDGWSETRALFDELKNAPTFRKYKRKRGGSILSVTMQRFLDFREEMEYDGKTVDEEASVSFEQREEADVSLYEDDSTNDCSNSNVLTQAKNNSLCSLLKEKFEGEFSEWMRRKGYAEASMRGILRALSYVDKFVLEQKISKTSLYAIVDYKKASFLFDKLSINPAFSVYKRRRSGYRLSSAIQKFLAFREEMEEDNKITDSDQKVAPFLRQEGKSDVLLNGYQAVPSSEYENEDDVYARQKEEFESDFSEWMRRNKYAKSTIYVYLGSLALLEDYIWEHYDSEASSLYAVATFQEANVLWDELKNDPSFCRYNLKKGRRLSTVMRLYLAFFKDLEDMGSEDDSDVDSSKPEVLDQEESKIDSPSENDSYADATSVPKKNREKLESAEENVPKTYRDVREMFFSLNFKSALSSFHKKSEFKTWLVDSGKPTKLAGSYNDSLKAMSVYLFDKKMEDRILFAIFSVSRLERILKKLIADPEYKSDDSERDFEALRLYIQFRKGNSSSEFDEEVVKRYYSVLRDRFENGFRIDSVIDRKRFKLYYSEIYGEDIPESDEELVNVMEQVGTLRDGRVYLRDGDNQNDLLDDIQADIAKVFRQGASCVYISCVFGKYRILLASHLQIYTEEALADRLLETCGHMYIRRGNYFYLGPNPDVVLDIQLALDQSLIPMTLEELQESLWFLPVDQIKKGITRNKKTVTVAKETYFYAPNFPASPQELNRISELIRAKVVHSGFIFDYELKDLIDENFPALSVDTADFTPRGLRAVFASLLGERFSFKGRIISEFGQKLSIAKVFEAFCEDRERMNFDELKEFADEMNSSTIYWDAVFEKMLRISESEFVRKGDVHFNVREIDAFLKTLIDGDYTSIRDVNLFLHFPPINVKWNVYVLEGYVAQYSKDFILLHSSYSSTGCFGAIVKKSSPFNSLDMIAVDVLAGDDEWNSTNDAVETLVREGYIQRKTFAKIDEVVEQAMALRAERTRN